MTPLQTALSLAEEYNIPVFPCRPRDETINGKTLKAKSPFTPHGFKDATKNIEQIIEYWEKWPDALIGVPTGAVSGLMILDVDPEGENWQLEHQQKLSPGRTQKTPRGHHLVYAAPGFPIKSSQSEIAKGVDVRADGGYAIWWAAHGYEAIGDMEDIAEAPAWLLERLREPAAKLTPKTNGAAKFGIGERHGALKTHAARLRRRGLKGAELEGALLGWNDEHCEPPQDRDDVVRLARDFSLKEGDDQAEPEPISLLALNLEKIMQPIAPERYLIPGMVPCEAYTLIAGALSAYKSTLLLYLIVWRATGYDFLNLNADGAGINIGPAVLIFYEDPDKRVLSKMHRILQSGYAQVERVHGERSAREFLSRATKNIRRIPFTGCFRKTIVTRVQGAVLPNEPMIAELLTKVREFSARDVLMGIDPLRLAIVGSQNDDDGADVVVHTLNRLSAEIPDSGIVVASHTTKSGAQDPAEGYTGKSYATSGSALYSQHARSNFHMARIKPDEIGKLFDPVDVPADEYGRQPVALLTHGRLSHGAESGQVYIRMKDGILLPLNTRELRSATAVSSGHLPLVVSVIDSIRERQELASKTALCADERLLKRIGSKHVVREILDLIEENGCIAFTGKTRDRDGTVTQKGRAVANGTNWDESAETMS